LTGRSLAALMAVCVIAAGTGFAAYRWWHAPEAAATSALRPDLEFRDLEGRAHRLSEWNGKLLIVNFWATWCAPCLKEIPLLVDAQQKQASRGLQVVGVAMDDAEPVRQMSARLKVNYPIMAGGTEVMSAMDQLGDTLGALPFSVLIAPDGRVLDRVSGGLKPEELSAWLVNLPS
jgi:thiol-disulfide isomerase/thioredoxin